MPCDNEEVGSLALAPQHTVASLHMYHTVRDAAPSPRLNGGRSDCPGSPACLASACTRTACCLRAVGYPASIHTVGFLSTGVSYPLDDVSCAVLAIVPLHALQVAKVRKGKLHTFFFQPRKTAAAARITTLFIPRPQFTPTRPVPPRRPAQGVVAAFRKDVPEGYELSFDAAIASNVPLGGGLSSSAALEVSVATLLEEITGEKVSGVEKALRQAEQILTYVQQQQPFRTLVVAAAVAV